jgi:hypothetical protein
VFEHSLSGDVLKGFVIGGLDAPVRIGGVAWLNATHIAVAQSAPFKISLYVADFDGLSGVNTPVATLTYPTVGELGVSFSRIKLYHDIFLYKETRVYR